MPASEADCSDNKPLNPSGCNSSRRWNLLSPAGGDETVCQPGTLELVHMQFQRCRRSIKHPELWLAGCTTASEYSKLEVMIMFTRAELPSVFLRPLL